jgi:hypothetical protein
MFAAFLRHAGIGEGDMVLDVGATINRSYEHSNYLEAWLLHNWRVTAVGIDEASFITAAHPGLTIVRADGRTLPFKDASFDFVQPSAVTEHVGSRKGQAIFLVELWLWLAQACS